MLVLCGRGLKNKNKKLLNVFHILFFIILPTINYITSNKLNYNEYIQYCSMNVKLFTLQILYFMTHNKSIHEINE